MVVYYSKIENRYTNNQISRFAIEHSEFASYE